MSSHLRRSLEEQAANLLLVGFLDQARTATTVLSIKGFYSLQLSVAVVFYLYV